jgi:signal peptidase I
VPVLSLLHPVPGHATPRSDRGAGEAGSTSANLSRSGPRPTAFLRRFCSAAGTVLIVLAVAAFLFLALGPRLLGYQTSTMLTGSMAPLINPGDVVVSVPVDVAELAVGDIITYHIPVEDQRVETHRIVDISTTADGSTTVQTKGDANNGVDPWTATLQGSTVYRHVAIIPHLGALIRTLRQPIVLHVLMYGAPAVLVAGLLASIWRREPVSAPAGSQDTTRGTVA